MSSKNFLIPDMPPVGPWHVVPPTSMTMAYEVFKLR